MNLKLLYCLPSLLFCLGIPSLKAQYIPDTSLTYNRFLKQCQEFSRSPQQEVWVVNFLASYDSKSLYQLGELGAIYASYRNKPVRFVSISVDKNRRYWEQMLIQFKPQWEQLFLPGQNEYNFLRRAFRHRSLPALFLVYPDGRIQRLTGVEELRRTLAEVSRDLPNRPYQDTAVVDPEDPFPIDTDPGSEENRTHRVKSGDTLFSLSRRYGVTVSQIQEANGLRGDKIKIGDVLIIPPS